MRHADEAMRFIRDTIDQRGYPPTRRELGEHLGLSGAKSGAQRILEHLVREGLIEIDTKVARGMRIKSTIGKASTEEMT